jgi:hypothetical protein
MSGTRSRPYAVLPGAVLATCLAALLALAACDAPRAASGDAGPAQRIDDALRDGGISRSMGGALRTQGTPDLPMVRERLDTDTSPQATTP